MAIDEIINTLRSRQNGRHFEEDIIKCIFMDENIWISIKISPNFAPKGQMDNISALVQIMAWCKPGDKPLSEPMMVSLLTYASIGLNGWNWELAYSILIKSLKIVLFCFMVVRRVLNTLSITNLMLYQTKIFLAFMIVRKSAGYPIKLM